MPDWALYRHSGIPAFMDIHCLDLCCMNRSMLQDQIRARGPRSCCMSSMSMSMMHAHVLVHAACPCPCWMFVSMLHVCVHAAYPCPCCMSMSLSLSMFMLHIHIFVYMYIYKCRNAGLSGIQSVWYRNEKKLTMPEQVRYWTKPTQSGIFCVRYRTKILDAGMPMPVLVCSIPMPSYI
jgi:hypothetical protein